MSEARALYDKQAVPEFVLHLKPGDKVLDIGKANDSLSAYYKGLLPAFVDFKTVDCVR